MTAQRKAEVRLLEIDACDLKLWFVSDSTSPLTGGL